MRVELSDGTRVDCEKEPMGGGASGTTYFSRDRKHVVKIHMHPPGNMHHLMEEVIGKYNCVANEPYWKQFMSWPDGIVVSPGLGIRMPCAPKGMDKMTWIVFPKLYNRLPPAKKVWDKRLVMAIRLAAAVARMHGCGVAHSDLSPNNIMVDPITGGLNLIDLDGLVVPGFLPPQVLGTPDYIAPEVLSHRVHGPSISTDRHALAVLLYQLLLFRHPFRGPKVYSHNVDEDERLALGESAVFIEHPTDTTNRPKKGFWSSTLLGDTFSKLFQRVFVDGLKDPTARPSANEWLTALGRLSDRVVGCGGKGCHEKYFPATEGRSLSCPWCKTSFSVREGLPVLRLFRIDKKGGSQLEKDYWIAGYPGKTLHSWHVETGVEPGPNAESRPLAQILFERGSWFLHNTGLHDARLIENRTLGKPIPVKGRVELKDGMALMLGPIPKARMAYVQWLK